MAMKIVVHNPTVHKNLELMKLLLKRDEERVSPKGKVYPLYINRFKGDFLIAGQGREPVNLKEKEWKKILVRMEISSEEKHLHFELLEDNQSSLKAGDLEPVAQRVLQETHRVLNYISRDLEQRMAADAALKEIPYVTIALSEAEKEKKDLVHEAWHQVDRLEAEQLLGEHPVGAFLFKKDIYAIYLEQQLEKSLQQSVKCITLTISEEKRKVSDFTLVKSSKGWLIYNDDPQLPGPYYPSVYILLETMKDKLIMPLVHN